MKLPSVLQKLTLNWQLKLAAFALAVLLWVVLSADQVTTQWLPVRVEAEIRDPAYEVAYGPVPNEVEVRFTGAGRELWELAINRPRLLLRVTEVDEDTELYILGPQMVQRPRGLSVTADDVRPSSVRMGFIRLNTRDVAITVPVGRGVQEGYVLLDSLIVRPAQVRVSGPAERVAQVTSVATRPLDLSREDTVFVRTVMLDTTGLGDLRLSALEVEVSGQVDRIGDRTVSGVVVSVPAGTAAIPARVDVRLRGPESVLRRVGPRELRVAANAGNAGAVQRTTTVPLRLEQLPRGLTAELSPGQVRLVPLLGTPALPGAPGPPVEPPDTLTEPTVEGVALPLSGREAAWRRR